MMYKVKFTSAFKKSYKRALKRGFDISILESVIDILTLTLADTGIHSDIFKK